MAQLKLELKKEVYIPYKVIIKMEEEPNYTPPTIPYNDDEDYYNYGQHWKLKGHQYEN